MTRRPPRSPLFPSTPLFRSPGPPRARHTKHPPRTPPPVPVLGSPCARHTKSPLSTPPRRRAGERLRTPARHTCRRSAPDDAVCAEPVHRRLGNDAGLRAGLCALPGRGNPPARSGGADDGEGKALLQRVAAFGDPPPLVVFTGGDPLRCPDIAELVAYGTRIGLVVSLTPSGTAAATAEKLG